MNTYEDYLKQTGEFGVVEAIRFPIVLVTGLPHAQPHEIVVFENGMYGEVFALQKNHVEVLLFNKVAAKVGEKLTRTNNMLSIPVGDTLFGKIIDPLGNLLYSTNFRVKAPDEKELSDEVVAGIEQRVKITKQFLTGATIIDTLMPLGKGQKELIIGDRKTGKTSFVLTAIKNQIVSNNTVVIYAAIGRKKEDIRRLEEFFKQEKLDSRIVMVATTSDDIPSLIYLTPYTAMTIAEYFKDQGNDVLIVFDDLTTHAKFYREISLILNRFPGRESYPGDIFYTHARLLERAGNFVHPEKKEVSITALPIAEIVEGDFTGYIATNLMGITDGHIYFDSDVYYRGRRPAINLLLSVTRVGKQTLNDLQKDVQRKLTSFLASYEKLQNFSHFGAELSDEIKQSLKTGEEIYELFTQPHTLIIPSDVQLILLAMVWLRMFDAIPQSGLYIVREKLVPAYAQPDIQKELHAITQVKTMDELLKKVTEKKDYILSLCK